MRKFLILIRFWMTLFFRNGLFAALMFLNAGVFALLFFLFGGIGENTLTEELSMRCRYALFGSCAVTGFAFIYLNIQTFASDIASGRFQIPDVFPVERVKLFMSRLCAFSLGAWWALLAGSLLSAGTVWVFASNYSPEERSQALTFFANTRHTLFSHAPDYAKLAQEEFNRLAEEHSWSGAIDVEQAVTDIEDELRRRDEILSAGTGSLSRTLTPDVPLPAGGTFILNLSFESPEFQRTANGSVRISDAQQRILWRGKWSGTAGFEIPLTIPPGLVHPGTDPVNVEITLDSGLERVRFPASGGVTLRWTDGTLAGNLAVWAFLLLLFIGCLSALSLMTACAFSFSVAVTASFILTAMGTGAFLFTTALDDWLLFSEPSFYQQTASLFIRGVVFGVSPLGLPPVVEMLSKSEGIQLQTLFPYWVQCLTVFVLLSVCGGIVFKQRETAPGGDES